MSAAVRGAAGKLFKAYEGLRITRITGYQVSLPLHELSYNWSKGQSVQVFDATVIKIETNDSNIFGYGETTPLGSTYLPAYAEGVRSGIKMMAPSLLGLDPTRLLNMNSQMDKVLKGHSYVKSAIDVACWDILGKVANLPVCELLGGRFNDDYHLYR
jgi:L-alanine-DL-glutamate epimerase-like enolase superfamily enzyme